MQTSTLEPIVRTAPPQLDHLRELEAESIHIIREVAAEFERPVMLYSIGKDSSVMLRLAQKAFYPGPIPFPLMHIDTGWKFREMISFRDRAAKQIGFQLVTYTNPRGAAEDIGPITHGSAYHTDVMKTEALKQALDLHGFDVAFGGARRPVVKRFGQWFLVDDNGLPLESGETPEIRMVRFRPLGCYPLTAAIESTAMTLDEIVAETLGATTSERQGRIIDHDGAGSME